MQVQAAVQSTRPPRVIVTVTDAPAGGTVSVYRLVGQAQALVRGMVDREPSAGAVTGVDAEQPLNRTFTYRAVHTSEEGVTTEAVSGPAFTEAARPWLIDPISVEGVEVEIQSWPTLQRVSRRQLINVSGTPFPAVMSGGRVAAASQIVFFVRDQDTLEGLRALSDVSRLLLRPTGDAVEPAYLSFGDVDEGRVREHDQDSWLRMVTVDVQEVAAPPASIPSIGDTLQDLHEYVGGETSTLAGLVSTFGTGSTLLDIARTQLRAGG